MNPEEIRQDFPQAPGVYLMKDDRGRTLYVGKASNLQKRVSSYFGGHERLPAKTRALMRQVQSMEYLVTGTEKEALLLESSLIKKHRPKYNIVLRDDKSYVLFKLDKSHDYPRLSLTRSVQQDQALYFGPFTSAKAARDTLQAINRIFPLRKCKSSVFAQRSRPCLQHQMRRCLAPCVLSVSKAEYWELVQELELFFQGRSKQLARRLKEEMQQAATDLKYEIAARKRDQLRALQSTVEQQAVVLPGGGDMDVLDLVQLPSGPGLGLIFVRQGKVLDSRNFYWRKSLTAGGQEDQEAIQAESGPEAEGQELLRSFLLQFYKKGRFIPERIVLPFALQDIGIQEILQERKGARLRLCPARRKSEKRLLELVKANLLQHEPGAEDQAWEQARELARKLGLAWEPARIEAVDVSHLGGQDVRVGQVVFQSGDFLREGYRIYNLPDLEGKQDDYQALRSWVVRRLRSGPPWPDMLLIDGGKGHLSTVQDMLQQGQSSQGLDLEGSWQLVSIAKESHIQGALQDKVYRPGRKNPVQLRPGDRELLLLQRLRDEAHRFVLDRQQKARSKKLYSGLQDLPGVGPATARLLWSRFGSLQAMRQAEVSELQELPGVGKKKAEHLQQVLRNAKNSSS
ncbi:MAG: excinuclease ABC subunit UvrC [Desulfohalobiaceae bacterium]